MAESSYTSGNLARMDRGLVSTTQPIPTRELHTASRGSVYLIVNDLIPNRVKIGFTTRDPIERAYELVTTGTTGTFVVIYQAYVINPSKVEREVHRRLRSHNCGLEWFEVCPNHAKELIWEVAGVVFFEEMRPRWHPSQPEPNAKTKVLLREAREAIEAEQRRKESEARQARVAAEEARIECAREQAEIRRSAEEQEYRRVAEEKAREAAVEEERRKQEEERQNRLVVIQQKKALQMKKAKAVFGTALIVAAAVVLTYSAVRRTVSVHSVTDIEARRSDLRVLEEEVDGLLAEIRRQEQRLTLVRDELQKSSELGPDRQKLIDEALDTADYQTVVRLVYAQARVREIGKEIADQRRSPNDIDERKLVELQKAAEQWKKQVSIYEKQLADEYPEVGPVLAVRSMAEVSEEERQLVEQLQERREALSKKRSQFASLGKSIKEMEMWNRLMFAPIQSPR